MDMYQKRKMRQEKVKNGNKEENSKYNINWYKPTYGKLPNNLTVRLLFLLLI